MLIGVGKATMVLGLLALNGALSSTLPRSAPHRAPSHHESLHPGPTRQMLMIRVSQESSPGAGDFDQNVLGFIQALQSDEEAADFYEYGRNAANYGNTKPVLRANTSHLFFVNAGDGLALFVVHNNSNHPENGDGGAAYTQWELSGGTASVVFTDDPEEDVRSFGGTMFTSAHNWAQSNTDGFVLGVLPVAFTLVGQFTDPPPDLPIYRNYPPMGLAAWEAISADGSRIQLSFIRGQRVRLDVPLIVRVRQDH